MQHSQSAYGFPASLPEDVLHQILQHCSPVDLHRVAQGSRYLCRIATEPKLWERHYYNFFRYQTSDARFPELISVHKHRLWRRRVQMRRWLSRILSEERGGSTNGTASGRVEQSLDDDLSEFVGEGGNETVPPMPDFYKVFALRMNLDTALLRDIYSHLSLVSHQLRSAADMVYKYRDSSRDFLHALTFDQTLTEENVVEVARAARGSYRREENWPSAYDVHERMASGSRRRPSAKYSIALLYCASSMLSHLQRREAVTTIRRLRSHYGAGARSLTGDLRQNTLQRSRDAELGIFSLALFRNGEAQELSEYLDLLALYISRRTAAQDDSDRDSESSTERARRLTRWKCSRIMSCLTELGFSIANPTSFLDLENSFVHISTICPHNRATIPLTLMIIFCAVARRLGIAAALCDTPGKIIAVVVDRHTEENSPQSGIGSDKHSSLCSVFYVDATYPDDAVRELSEVIDWTVASSWPVRQGPAAIIEDTAALSSLHLTPADPVQIMMRSARNIYNAVQNDRPIFDVLAEEGEGTRRSGLDDDSDSSPPLANQHTLTTLQSFLSSHPQTMSTDNAALAANLGILQPLRRSSIQLLPTRRRQAAADKDEDALFASCWTMMELSEELAQQGKHWLVVQISQRHELDVLLLPGAEAYARAQGVQVFHCSPSINGDDAPVNRPDDGARGSVASGSDFESDSDREPTDRFSRFSNIFLSFFGSIWSSDRAAPDVKRRPADGTEERTEWTVRHRVGSLFIHRRYGYRAVILGWDVTCQASDMWQRQMGVDGLPGGRQQPFYNIQADDGTARYVAECNIVPLEEMVTAEGNMTGPLRPFTKLLRARGLGKYFRGLSVERPSEGQDRAVVSQARLLLTARTQAAWPDD